MAIAQDRDGADDGIDATGRKQQADEPGEDDERHHPRLEKREVVSYARLAAGTMDAIAVSAT